MRKIAVSLSDVESFGRSVSSLLEENERTRSSIDDASRQVSDEVGLLSKRYDEELGRVHEDLTKAKNVLAKMQSELQKITSKMASTPKTITTKSSDGSMVTSSNPAYESLANMQQVAASKVNCASSLVSSFSQLDRELSDEQKSLEVLGRRLEEGANNCLKSLQKEAMTSGQVQEQLNRIINVLSRYESATL